MALKVYAYEKCDTCRKALKLLKEAGVNAQVIPIRESPPTPAELRAMLDYMGGDLRRLFNTSGQDYKAMNMKDRLPNLSADEAIELLAKNGNLVKRPFAIASGRGLVGFKPEEWASLVAAL